MVDIEYKFEDLEKLKNGAAGWISPEGVLTICRYYEHNKVLRTVDDLSSMIDDIETYKYDDERDFANGFDPGDHIEWHYYSEPNTEDMWADVIVAAYKLGWVRIACEGQDVINFEGYTDGLRKLDDHIEYITEMVSRDATLHHFPE